MQAGDASGTGLLDLPSRKFDTTRMARIDPDWAAFFPDLVSPTARIGTVTPDVAETLGLPPRVLVAPGSGDNMMSALGSGAVEEGDLVVSLGTSGTVFGLSNEPVFDPTGAIAPFCDATGALLFVQLFCRQATPWRAGRIRTWGASPLCRQALDCRG